MKASELEIHVPDIHATNQGIPNPSPTILGAHLNIGLLYVV
jgi:hypothetical protein